MQLFAGADGGGFVLPAVRQWSRIIPAAAQCVQQVFVNLDHPGVLPEPFGVVGSRRQQVAAEVDATQGQCAGQRGGAAAVHAENQQGVGVVHAVQGRLLHGAAGSTQSSP